MTPIPAHLLASIFDREPVARLAVIDDDGVPEVMPIVFARVATRFFSPIDGKPKKSGRLARLRRIERCPRVGLVIDRYAADWRALWWIRIAAQASIAVGQDADWDAAVTALRSKYPQYRTTALFEGEPTLICFEPLTVRCWAAAGLEHFTREQTENPADG